MTFHISSAGIPTATAVFSQEALDAAMEAHTTSAANPESNGTEEDMRRALEAAFAVELATLDARARDTFEPLIDELVLHAKNGYGPITRGHRWRLNEALGRDRDAGQ